MSMKTVGLWLALLTVAAVSPTPVDRSSTQVVIHAAPSVVSYQGSSQSYAHLVIAPMGRALGYVQPPYVNSTVLRSEKLKDSFNYLDISPVYVHQ